jgi:hypothetical protein
VAKQHLTQKYTFSAGVSLAFSMDIIPFSCSHNIGLISVMGTVSRRMLIEGGGLNILDSYVS